MAGTEREPQEEVINSTYKEIEGYFKQLNPNSDDPNTRTKELTNGTLAINKIDENEDYLLVDFGDYWFSSSKEKGILKIGLPDLVFPILDYHQVELDEVDITKIPEEKRKAVSDRFMNKLRTSMEMSYSPGISDFAPRFIGNKNY